MKKLLIAVFAVMLAVAITPLGKADTISSPAAYNSVNVTSNESFAEGVVIKDWEQDTSTVESGVTYAQFHTNFSVVLPASGCVNRVEFHVPDLGFNETNTTDALAATNITLYNTTFNNIAPGTAIWTGKLDPNLVNAEGYYIINLTNWTTTDAAEYASQVCSGAGGNFNATIVYYSEPIWITKYGYDSVSGSSVTQFFNVTTNHTKNNINFTGVKLAQMEPDKWYQRISGNTTVFYDTWGNSTQYSGSDHISVATGSAGYVNVSGVDARGSLNNISISFTKTASSSSEGSSSSSGGVSSTTPVPTEGISPVVTIYIIAAILIVSVLGGLVIYLYGTGRL